MTNDIDSPNSGWHLLAELALKAELKSIQQAAELVAETLQELSIQTALAECIQRTVIEALQGMLENGKLDQQDSHIRIRILVSGAPNVKETEDNDLQKGHNWGFFLLEKRRNSPEVPHHRLELFLYQETK